MQRRGERERGKRRRREREGHGERERGTVIYWNKLEIALEKVFPFEKKLQNPEQSETQAWLKPLGEGPVRSIVVQLSCHMLGMWWWWWWWHMVNMRLNSNP